MKYFPFLFFLVLSTLNSNCQVIATVAGNGSPSYSGDNGSAAQATLNTPGLLTADKFGNIFIADINNNCIRKIDKTGIITTIAGNGTEGYSGDGGNATNAQLKKPASVLTDDENNIYIADQGNHCIRKIDAAGIIHTIAGNGNAGFSGDNGNAIAAQLNEPYGISKDVAGNIYIADYGNNRVRKIDINGIVTTIAGNGTAGFSGDKGSAMNAMLNGPVAILARPGNIIYFSDSRNNRIRKIDSSGVIFSLSNSTALKNPSGITFDNTGNLYIADADNNRIRRISVNNINTTVAGSGVAGFSGDGDSAVSAKLNTPAGVVFDNNGNLYIADKNNHCIRRINSTPPPVINSFSPLFGKDRDTIIIKGSHLSDVIAVQFGGRDATSFSILSDSTISAILSIGYSGNVNVIKANGFTASLSGFVFCAPIYLSVEIFPTGNLIPPSTLTTITAEVTIGGYIPETIEGFSLLYQWMKNNTPVGTGSYIYSDSTLKTNDSIWCIVTVPVDPRCSVPVTAVSNKIGMTVYPDAGILTLFAGLPGYGYTGDGGSARDARLNFQQCIALDKKGNLYIADTYNHVIRKVDQLGIISTVAGNGIGGYSGDNIAATNAQLYNPSGVAIDETGNIFIADRDNNRIRKVDTSGIITTVAGNGLFGPGVNGENALMSKVAGPWSVAVDKKGTIYLCDGYAAIRKVDSNGINKNIAVTLAKSMAIDSAGNIYFCDELNGHVKKIDTAGIITIIAGNGTNGFSGDGGPANLASLFNPQSLTFDKWGNLYFTDVSNYRVRKIDKNNIIYTVAGKGEWGASPDGIAAINARFAELNSIAVNESGLIYLSDRYNSEVKVIKRSIVISSFSPSFADSGSIVTIKGKNLAGCTVVKFGEINAPFFNIVNDSTIEAAVSKGVGNITVYNEADSSSLAYFVYSPIYKWTGAVSNIWENPLNWDSGRIPYGASRVIINSGTVILNSNATIWSLTLGQSAILNVAPANRLTILH